MRVGTRNAATTALVGAAILAICVGSAKAHTITVKDDAIDTSTGIFTYMVTLDSTTEINAGGGFVIYDFGGYVPNSATLTPLTGNGTLGLSDFMITTTTTDTTPVNNQGQGNDLIHSASVNSLAQSDADSSMGVDPDGYPDPDSGPPGNDMLSNPTFDNPATPNLSFVYTSGNTYLTTGDETYLLTLYTSLVNSNNQVSLSVVATEDQDWSNFDLPSFAQNLLQVPYGSNNTQVALPEPSALALIGIAGSALIRRKPRRPR